MTAGSFALTRTDRTAWSGYGPGWNPAACTTCLATEGSGSLHRDGTSSCRCRRSRRFAQGRCRHDLRCRLPPHHCSAVRRRGIGGWLQLVRVIDPAATVRCACRSDRALWRHVLLVSHAGPKGQVHLVSRKDPLWLSSVRAYPRVHAAPRGTARYRCCLRRRHGPRNTLGPTETEGLGRTTKKAWFATDSDMRSGIGPPEVGPFSIGRWPNPSLRLNVVAWSRGPAGRHPWMPIC